MIKISYDSEGDLLEVQFAQSSEPPRGIGLTDHITLFFDKDLKSPLAFTVVSYAKLLALSSIPLTELLEAPEDIQKKVRESLQHQPLTRFIHLRGDVIELEDIRMSELVHP